MTWLFGSYFSIFIIQLYVHVSISPQLFITFFDFFVKVNIKNHVF